MIKQSRTLHSVVFATLAIAATSTCHADTFGSGENQFEIPFVTIGNPGNPADTTGRPNPAGSVGYVYQIGKYEVPEEAIKKANAQSALDGDPLDIPFRIERGDRKPMTGINWPNIARFVNWLNEDKGHQPAYKFDDQGASQLWEAGDLGFDPDNQFRNSLAVYVLPTIDEWYKAAFYDPTGKTYFDYATGSDDVPTPTASGNQPGTVVYQQAGPADVELAGGFSPYGTVGQSGNVIEFMETAFDQINDSATETRRGMGGDWAFASDPSVVSSSVRFQTDIVSRPLSNGFRIVRIPEPVSIAIAFAMVGCWLCRRLRSA